jgi:hypothetical protein
VQQPPRQVSVYMWIGLLLLKWRHFKSLSSASISMHVTQAKARPEFENVYANLDLGQESCLRRQAVARAFQQIRRPLSFATKSFH